MSFDAQEVFAIIDGHAHAWLDGPPVWTAVNSTWRGEVSVCADGFDAGEVKFILNVSTRPNAPTFVLSIRNSFCRRLDVNQRHHEFDGTHIQGRDRSDADEWVKDAIGAFPPIPESGIVASEQYAATFLAFAASVGVAQGTFEWIDAPEGRP